MLCTFWHMTCFCLSKAYKESIGFGRHQKRQGWLLLNFYPVKWNYSCGLAEKGIFAIGRFMIAIETGFQLTYARFNTALLSISSLCNALNLNWRPRTRSNRLKTRTRRHWLWQKFNIHLIHSCEIFHVPEINVVFNHLLQRRSWQFEDLFEVLQNGPLCEQQVRTWSTMLGTDNLWRHTHGCLFYLSCGCLTGAEDETWNFDCRTCEG